MTVIFRETFASPTTFFWTKHNKINNKKRNYIKNITITTLFFPAIIKTFKIDINTSFINLIWDFYLISFYYIFIVKQTNEKLKQRISYPYLDEQMLNRKNKSRLKEFTQYTKNIFSFT